MGDRCVLLPLRWEEVVVGCGGWPWLAADFRRQSLLKGQIK
jgi:hypothetical protein